MGQQCVGNWLKVFILFPETSAAIPVLNRFIVIMLILISMKNDPQAINELNIAASYDCRSE